MTLVRPDAFWATLTAREANEIGDDIVAEQASNDGRSARADLAGSIADDFAAPPAIGTIRTPRHHLTINLLGSIDVLAGGAIRVR